MPPESSPIVRRIGVDHHPFELAFTPSERGLELGIRSEDASHAPLANVVSTAWVYGIDAFLSAVIAHRGQSFEDVGFTWEGDDAPPDYVTLIDIDDELHVPQRIFRDFVLSVAFTTLEVTRELGLPGPAWKDRLSDLKAS